MFNTLIFHLHLLNKNFEAECFSERKHLLRHMLAREITRSWCMQTKLPKAGLNGKDKQVCHPWIGSFVQVTGTQKKYLERTFPVGL